MSWRRKRNSRFFTRRSSWLSLTTALVSWSALSPSRWTCFSTTADGTFRIKRGECVCLLADAVRLWCVWLLYCVCFRESQAGAKLSLNRQFADERWSKHRVVTCLDWSPQVRSTRVTLLLTLFQWSYPVFCRSHQYPELLVASYSSNEDAPHEPDGVALVWNMKYKKTTPEYVFHCQVMSFMHVSVNDVNYIILISSSRSQLIYIIFMLWKVLIFLIKISRNLIIMIIIIIKTL